MAIPDTTTNQPAPNARALGRKLADLASLDAIHKATPMSGVWSGESYPKPE